MKVDENMKRAHARDAINTQKFYFRKHIAPPAEDIDPPVNNIDSPKVGPGPVESKCDPTVTCSILIPIPISLIITTSKTIRAVLVCNR